MNHGSLSLSTIPESKISASSKVILNDGTTEAEAHEIIRTSEEFLAFVHSLDIYIDAIQDTDQAAPALTRAPIGASAVGQKRVGQVGTRIEKCCQMACALYLASAFLGLPSALAITALPIRNMVLQVPAWILSLVHSRMDSSSLQFDAGFLFSLFQGDDEAAQPITHAERLWLAIGEINGFPLYPSTEA
ncbi:hypothetical protein MMC15_004117 [Xylographa vitiligo]|nr:hypothetical protein [Xylographa vitiligo]